MLCFHNKTQFGTLSVASKKKQLWEKKLFLNLVQVF